jgi:uncharacterized phage protein gp47/JayE
MGEMMDAFGANVRTDEGSLAWNACAKIAEKLEEVYGDMDAINDNILPDTQDLDHLIRYAKERGLEYKYATAPIVKGVFQQEIEIGERFACGDYSYTVTELIAGYEYQLECETEGTEANTTLGELESIDYIEDYNGGQITQILVDGTDDEDEEVFRQRVFDSFKSVAFGGNKANYRSYINAIDGVGGCKPKRRVDGETFIHIPIISNIYGIPSAELVDEVQTIVDPLQNQGEGDGLAPIDHQVIIEAVEGVNVEVSTTITFDSGYSVDTSRTLIEGAIGTYLGELCKGWEANELEVMYVRLSKIDASILNVEGVLDVTGTKINGVEENLVLNYSQIPILGGVTIV